MKVTYLGTTMLLFDDGRDQILFDCHITRPSLLKCMFGIFKTDTYVADRVIKDFKIDRLKAIFISHTHHDHVMDAPYFALECCADIYGSESAVNVAIGGGVDKNRIHCYDDEMQYCIGEYTIKIIPSVHSEAHWYNNDLGQVIDKPLVQPAKKKAYKEGGSYDFLVEHSGRRYLIRPSYNYLMGQLDGIKANVLFQGIAGFSHDTNERKRMFFAETVDKVEPKIVIPVHWDNFFHPLYNEAKWKTAALDIPKYSIEEIKKYCESKNIEFILQLPLSSVEV